MPIRLASLHLVTTSVGRYSYHDTCFHLLSYYRRNTIKIQMATLHFMINTENVCKHCDVQNTHKAVLRYTLPSLKTLIGGYNGALWG